MVRPERRVDEVCYRSLVDVIAYTNELSPGARELIGMEDPLVSIALNVVFWAGVRLAIRPGPEPDWIDDFFSTLVAGFAAIVVVLELLGLVGQINRGALTTVCLGSGMLGVSLHLARSRRTRGVAHPARHMLFPRVSWASMPAWAAMSLTAWAALVYLLSGLVLPIEPVSDAPIYHVPFALRWWQTGSLDLVATPFGDAAATYFPANGELWLTWLMVTSSNGVLVKVAQWPFMLVGATALYGLGRRAGVRSSAAVFPALVWMSMPLTLTQSAIANIDLVWSAFYLVAVYFLLRWLEDARARDGRPLHFFALACGIVIGSKAVGVLFVLLLLVVPVVVSLRQHPRRARRLAAFAAGLLLPSGFWYLRSVWLTGNPLYPLQLSVFGHVIAEGWYARQAMDAAAYHLPVADWRALLGRLHVVGGSVGFGLGLAGLAAGGVLIRRTSVDPTSRRVVATCCALSLAHIVIYWFLVPYNTQERFILPALGLALVPLAAVAAVSPLVQLVFFGLLAWQLLAISIGPEGEWLTLLRLYDNPVSLGQIWVTLRLPAAIVGAVLIVQWSARARVALAALVVLIGCYASVRPAAALLAEQTLFDFYPRAGFAARLFAGWEILEQHAAPGGSNVAYTGTNLPYYLYGRALRNNVHYINVNRHPDWLFHDYHRELLQNGVFRLAEDPFPQWYRAEADFEAWVANLRQRDIEFVFIGRENRHGRLEPYPGTVPEFPIERRWADMHPDLFEDLGPFHDAPGRIPWVRVYRLRGTAPAVRDGSRRLSGPLE